MGINVLSLFDGMSCGQIALNRAGIDVNNYYASEVDKYAIQVSQNNYPDTVQLGSIVKINTKTILLSEVYSYICKKYFKNDIHSLQSIISEWEMLHRINESETFCSYFGAQEQIDEGETQSDTSVSINDRVWFYKNKVGDNKSVFDIVRSGERRAISNNVNVGELCKHSFWWNGNRQQECGTSQESFIGADGIKEVRTDKTKITRDSYETIFNDRIERASEKEGDRTISRSAKKENVFNSNEQTRQKINGGEKEGNRKDKKGSKVQEDERIIQASHEVNRISEINRIQLSIYNEVQVTVIECEWGVIIFKGIFQMTFGGSPCQSFSSFGNGKGLDGKSGLFFEYVRVLNELKIENPDIKFMLENVNMKKEWKDIITSELSIEPVAFNSNLVSAQNRDRLYWTNIDFIVPSDKNVLLEDILEDLKFREIPKCFYKNWGDKMRIDKGLNWIKNKKANCLTTKNCHTNQYLLNEDKSLCRLLTANEFEVLQTVPLNYTSIVSNTERFKMLGNGWTVDVIAHIFENLKQN